MWALVCIDSVGHLRVLYMEKHNENRIFCCDKCVNVWCVLSKFRSHCIPFRPRAVVTHSASKLLAYNVHVDRQNLRARATEMQNVWWVCPLLMSFCQNVGQSTFRSARAHSQRKVLTKCYSETCPSSARARARRHGNAKTCDMDHIKFLFILGFSI